ncbi:peptidylprolyl isomerase [Alteromonas oceanisediminis]|uniref:peptidylprolyl isomerase n=1 Tax=Alteromonas oceanisediminis TaxID=2836180 RepID=UPI001BDAA23B|nr:peptidylprolyl isomerase [Alteromonas oceanisediminis]MBT0587401.1 peptidyl-prolyl cis-trans isomerase [Alteromonas oceanisediminis]
MITLHTSMGDITLELYADKAPNTVENFLRYAREGFFDGTIFHRIIPNFMVQGGGFTADMEQKDTHAPIENEANNGVANERGTIAMARTNDPHSATSQFFINGKDNDFLDFQSETMNGWGYCAFGKVTEGMDVVEKMEGVKTGNHGYHADVPVEPIVIESVTVSE